MLGPRQQIARMQSDYYRDKFRRILRWLLMTIVLIFIMIGTVIYLLFNRPQRPYYANTTDGKILLMPRTKS